METKEWKELRQWVLWQRVPNKNGGKPRKVPTNPRDGRYAKFNDPTTWTTACEAWSSITRLRNSGIDIGGITFVMTLEAGVVGIDLDNCFIEDGGRRFLKPYAKRAVQMLHSRTEYSPSGNGLHIFCTGLIKENIHKPLDGFEMYADKHGLTVTGKPFDATEFGLESLPVTLEERTAEMSALAAPYAKVERPPRPSYRGSNGESVSEERIAELLGYLPKHMDYNDWLFACMAVHSVYPDYRGVALIEEWSPGETPEDVPQKFRSFKRTGVSIAWLFAVARKYGWSSRHETTNELGFVNV